VTQVASVRGIWLQTAPMLWRVGSLAVLLGSAFILSVRVGSVSLGTRAIVETITGRGDPTVRAIILDLRLPRAVSASLVGAALATSGVTFQALLQNALAEPYVLGVSGGAALGAVGSIVIAQFVPIPWSAPVGTFIGASAAIAIVVRIARGVGPTLDTRVLLLAGVVVGAFANAAIWLLLTVADVAAFRSAMDWMMGSLSGVTWHTVTLLAAVLGPASLTLFALARPLNALAMGEETAGYLGVPVERVKWIAYAAASLLAAAAVTAAGIIGFVGLIVPHAVRLAGVSDHRALLPTAAVLGAAFLLLTDVTARTVTAPTELPLGALTALIGVPLFVVLLRRRVP
jgi:iron complex transport system permease protein